MVDGLISLFQPALGKRRPHAASHGPALASLTKVTMTSQGAALTHYRRVIEAKSVPLAELSAREMGHVPLPDALALVLPYATTGSPKAEPAAVRWLARLALERPRTTIGELQLAAAALDQLAERPKTASRMLLELAT